jgi:hypothetical protein
VHHRTVQINHQPDATFIQFIILTFAYSSTCFGRFPAHHQELNDCSGSLLFYLRIVVIVVLCSWSDRPAVPLPLYNGSPAPPVQWQSRSPYTVQFRSPYTLAVQLPLYNGSPAPPIQWRSRSPHIMAVPLPLYNGSPAPPIHWQSRSPNTISFFIQNLLSFPFIIFRSSCFLRECMNVIELGAAERNANITLLFF